MVKSSSPNAPSTWIIFFVPIPTLPRRTCLHSASSVLAVPLVAALSHCLCSESPYLSIKLYRIYQNKLAKVVRNAARGVFLSTPTNPSTHSTWSNAKDCRRLVQRLATRDVHLPFPLSQISAPVPWPRWRRRLYVRLYIASYLCNISDSQSV
jgi:hypothetical protein